jgi:hypothetical protein
VRSLKISSSGVGRMCPVMFRKKNTRKARETFKKKVGSPSHIQAGYDINRLYSLAVTSCEDITAKFQVMSLAL